MIIWRTRFPKDLSRNSWIIFLAGWRKGVNLLDFGILFLWWKQRNCRKVWKDTIYEALPAIVRNESSRYNLNKAINELKVNLMEYSYSAREIFLNVAMNMLITKNE